MGPAFAPFHIGQPFLQADRIELKVFPSDGQLIASLEDRRLIDTDSVDIGAVLGVQIMIAPGAAGITDQSRVTAGDAGKVQYDITPTAAPDQVFPVSQRDAAAVRAAQISPDLGWVAHLQKRYELVQKDQHPKPGADPADACGEV